MTLRQPPTGLTPPTLDDIQSTQWHTLNYTLATPMYGGGVDAHTADAAMPIRASAIRGQLRFWWRLLAQQPGWKLGNADDIRRAEFALWGGMGDKDPIASKVLIKVNTVGKAKVQPWASFQPNHNNKLTLQSEKWADLPYALFPAQGKLEFGKVTEQPHELAQAGLQWQLAIHFTHGKPLKAGRPNFNPNITPDEEAQVWETIRWWSNFGGIGARTRRGLGAVHLNSVSTDVPPKILTPITVEEAQTAGCQLVLKGASTNPYAVWQTAVNKLKEFRQGSNLGRNAGQQANRPGRSRWPEPDAVRRSTSQSAAQHAPVHPAGKIFPRAAFGLPIIFHFQGGGDPTDTSLNPVINNKVVDRMASPVILRPIHTGSNAKGEAQWAAGALLLPHQHLVTLKLQLLDVKNQMRLIEDVEYWNQAQAGDIPAIAQNGGNTPLQAFMTYFAK